MKWGVTKVKHPNKGHTPNKGQKPMYQGVRYSESPLYYYVHAEFLEEIRYNVHVLIYMYNTYTCTLYVHV